MPYTRRVMPINIVMLGHLTDNGTTHTALDVDDQTHALVTIEVDHHHIHEGLAYSITGAATLNAAATSDFIFVTPNSDWLVHLRVEVYGEAEGTLAIFEGATYTGGAAITKADYSLNRDAPQDGYAAVYTGTTVTGTGTQRRIFAFGAGQVGGGGVDSAHEIVLKRNTVYLVRITSDAAGNEIHHNIFWYEHSETE